MLEYTDGERLEHRLDLSDYGKSHTDRSVGVWCLMAQRPRGRGAAGAKKTSTSESGKGKAPNVKQMSAEERAALRAALDEAEADDSD
jgi:hypothetical protein